MKNWLIKNINPSGKNLILPFYHAVSDEKCPHISNLYPVKKIQEFERELDFFQKNYEVINLDKLLNYVQNKTRPEKKSFFLSFDDGLKECYTVIAPILKERKIPAAFFINTGFVNNQDLFYRYKVSLLIEALKSSNYSEIISTNDLLKLTIHDTPKIDEIAKKLNVNFQEFLENEKPYMNWEEIKELYEQGFYIGAHSINHPYYYQISLEEQVRQTKESIETVTHHLNPNYRIFSFPFTDYLVTKSLYNRVYTEGICDLTFGTAGIKDDELNNNLQRISMEKCTINPATYIGKELFQYRLKKLINKNRVIHPE